MIRSLSNAMRIWHWTSPRTPVASATSTLQSRHFPFLNTRIRTAAITARTDRFPYAARFDGAECPEGPDSVRDRPIIASDGLKWVVFERAGESLVKIKDTILDPDKTELFLAWLDGAVALNSALRGP